jgi:hypothetical protein
MYIISKETSDLNTRLQNYVSKVTETRRVLWREMKLEILE